MKLFLVVAIVVNALLLTGAGYLKPDEATIDKKINALTALVNALTGSVEKILAREHEAAVKIKEIESGVKGLQSGPYPQLTYIGQGRCGGDNMTKIRSNKPSFAGCVLICEGKRKSEGPGWNGMTYVTSVARLWSGCECCKNDEKHAGQERWYHYRFKT